MNIQESPPTSPFRKLFNKNKSNDSSNMSFDDYFEEKRKQNLQIKLHKAWTEKPFRIICIIVHFRNKLKKLIIPRLDSATSSQINLINDKCYFENFEDRIKKSIIESQSENEFMAKRYIRRLKRKIRKFCSWTKQKFSGFIFAIWTSLTRFCSRLRSISLRTLISDIIEEETLSCKTRLYWDMLIFLLLVSLLLYVPFFASFVNDPFLVERGIEEFNIHVDHVYQGTCIIMLILDICFNFKIGFYKKGVFIKEPKAVALHYLKPYHFFFDLISVITLIIGFWTDYSNYVVLVFMINFFKVNRIRNKLMFVFSLNGRSFGFVKLIFLSFWVLYLSHVCACFWFMTALIQKQLENTGESWLEQNNLQDKDWFDKYVCSFYFSIVTIVTVGYGDVTPKNTFEKLVACSFIIVGCFTFGFCINKVGIIIQEWTRDKEEFKEKIVEIDKYMRTRNVDFDIQIKVKNYFEWIYRHQDDFHEREEKLINSINKRLRDALLQNVYGKWIKKIDFFQKYFSKDFLFELALNARKKCFLPEEIIIEQNEENHLKGFFLLFEGKIEYFLKFPSGEELIFKQTEEEHSIGISYLLTGVPEKYSIRTITFSQFIFIERASFMNLIKKYPEDQEVIHNLNLYSILPFSSLPESIPCFSCQSKAHQVFTCPKIHLALDKSNIIKKICYSEKQIRRGFNRKSTKSMGFLKNRKTVQLSVYRIGYDTYYEQRKRNRLKDAVLRINVEEEIKDFHMFGQNLPNYYNFNENQKLERGESEENEENYQDENNKCIQTDPIGGEENDNEKKSEEKINNDTVQVLDSYPELHFFERIKSYKFFSPHNNPENIIPLMVPSYLMKFSKKKY